EWVRGGGSYCVCDHLGIATQKQQDRIERSPWSKGRTTIMVVRLPDTDRSRGYFLLDSDRFAMWMATVDTSRLKNPDARDRIERWQNRSEEHTSELQSRENLVCRLLL